MSLFLVIYQFFSTLVFAYSSDIITYPLYQKLFIDTTFTIGSQTYRAIEYYSFICAFVATIIVVVLCCLFVYKIIKLIGGLIR